VQTFIFGILYFKLNGIDTINMVTNLWVIQCKDTIYNGRDIKG
jgi:hypothetical protein